MDKIPAMNRVVVVVVLDKLVRLGIAVTAVKVATG
jgi:hypothetical protein